MPLGARKRLQKLVGQSNVIDPCMPVGVKSVSGGELSVDNTQRNSMPKPSKAEAKTRN